MVAIKKKTGQYRVHLDARHLNSIMVNEGYSTPQIAAITNNLRSSKYISSIDHRSDSIHSSVQRPLQFKVVPFGLCTASQALARLMTHLFADLESLVFHYLDDIIIYSETFEEHIALLEEVARRLRQANLTISSEKSKFCRKSMKYIGYVIDEPSLVCRERVDAEKIQVIVQFPTRKEVQHFLGV